MNGHVKKKKTRGTQGMCDLIELAFKWHAPSTARLIHQLTILVRGTPLVRIADDSAQCNDSKLNHRVA